MRGILVGLTMALALSGCASSSGVFQTGPGAYRITTTAITSFGGAGKARGEGVKRANAYCAGQGKKAIVTDAASSSDITQGSSDISFRCEAGE